MDPDVRLFDVDETMGIRYTALCNVAKIGSLKSHGLSFLSIEHPFWDHFAINPYCSILGLILRNVPSKKELKWWQVRPFLATKLAEEERRKTTLGSLGQSVTWSFWAQSPTPDECRPLGFGSFVAPSEHHHEYIV